MQHLAGLREKASGNIKKWTKYTTGRIIDYVNTQRIHGEKVVMDPGPFCFAFTFASTQLVCLLSEQIRETEKKNHECQTANISYA